jgi:ABC1 atypical kinase-like domain
VLFTTLLVSTAGPEVLCMVKVYRARLRGTGEEVAVKVQRPNALSTISKDLYVLRRGVGVYEQLVKRFTAQTTDYQELLSTFAEARTHHTPLAHHSLQSKYDMYEHISIAHSKRQSVEIIVVLGVWSSAKCVEFCENVNLSHTNTCMYRRHLSHTYGCMFPQVSP